MTDTAVRMNVRTIDDKVSVIDVVGSVTRASEQALMDAYTQASGPQTHVIVLNVEGLEYMNSSGIGLLVTLLVRANRQQQTVFAFGLTAHYQDIFSLTRLNEAIHLYTDESSALAAAHQA
jgi:anti-sigma B factor antagonist